MTIYTWFLTFGFKISLKDYMVYNGYTRENMTDEMVEKYIDEGEDIVYNWFYDEKIDGNFVLSHIFEVDGIEFIARGFTHDKKDSKNIVIGIDLGEIDRWNGKLTVNDVNCEEQIKIMLKCEEIRKIISSSEGNATTYSLIEHGVKDPKYPTFSITPAVHITQNDCDCCS